MVRVQRAKEKIMNYNIGDIVFYSPFGGGVRKVLVTLKEADIKNGRSGFDGIDQDGFGVWGYDSQITHVRPAEKV
jgi:hypothetical protein